MDKDAYLYKIEGTEIDAKIQDLMSNEETTGNADFFFKKPQKSPFAEKIAKQIKTVSWNLNLNTKKLPSIGVKTLINALKIPFDAEATANRVVKSPNSKYYGMDPVAVVAQWKSKGQAAGAKGVGIDVYASKIFDNAPIDISTWSDEMKACCKQFDLLKSELLDPIKAELVCREQWVQDKNNIKGRIDALFNVQEKLMLVDWKSNEEIPISNSFGTKMLGPAEMLDDCKANDFTLQLYFYKYFFQKYFNIQIASCRIGWIRPNGYYMLKPNFPYSEMFLEDCIAFGLQVLNKK